MTLQVKKVYDGLSHRLNIPFILQAPGRFIRRQNQKLKKVSFQKEIPFLWRCEELRCIFCLEEIRVLGEIMKIFNALLHGFSIGIFSVLFAKKTKMLKRLKSVDVAQRLSSPLHRSFNFQRRNQKFQNASGQS